MQYGKVNELGLPIKPKIGWYKIKIDKGTLGFCNPHRKGTKAYQKAEEKYLKRPVDERTIETKARLSYFANTNKAYWTDCAYLCNYAGYHVKVIGARRIPDCYQ